MATLADDFRSRHQGPTLLVLPNAWDVASAQVIAGAGFPAIATTSTGITATQGWGNGESIPPNEMFRAVRAIARAVTIPVTADLKAGYGLEPVELVARMLEAGVVGCNLEDSNYSGGTPLRDATQQSEYLAAVKQAARDTGVDLVINARVDVYARSVGDPGGRAQETLRRALLYQAAGADCIYPILLSDEAEIRALVQNVATPVNILAVGAAPPLARLRELGVRRVSYGGSLQKAALAEHQRIVLGIKAETDLID